MFILLCIFFPFVKAKVERQIQMVQAGNSWLSEHQARHKADLEYINNYHEAMIKDLNDPYALELGRLNIETVCHVLETQFKDDAKEFTPSMLSDVGLITVRFSRSDFSFTQR